MVPSRVRTHSGHVIPPVNSKDIGALKAAVIYGANASGKSNLIKAMHFARLMITQGSPQGKNLNYDPFLLDKGCSQKPSRFEFEIKCGNNNYAYGFIADSKSIREEWLYKIDKKGESPVFVRTDEHKILFPAIKFKSNKMNNFYHLLPTTPEHRLFLFECQDRNVTKALDYVQPLTEVNNWFHHRLNIVFPNSKYHGLEMVISSDTVSNLLAGILRSFDTGINDLSLKQVDLMKDVHDIPDHIKQDIMATIEAGEAGR